jgi:hypothetical protein
MAPEACAQWNSTGEGAVVIAESVTVYSHSKGGDVSGVFVRNELIAADGPGKKFKDQDGRYKVTALYKDGKKKKVLSGWVDPSGLSPAFQFPCSCAQGCWPFDENSSELKWNRCFVQAALLAAPPPIQTPTPGAEAVTANPVPTPSPGGSR